MYKRIDGEEVIKTINKLRDRIVARFPDAGLSRVAQELHDLAATALDRARRIREPHILLRLLVVALVLASIAIIMGILVRLRIADELSTLSQFVQFSESAVQSAIFCAAGIYFLIDLETRLKRRRALEAIHELRAIAHIIDMHQLTKDPERAGRAGSDTAASPQRLLTPFLLGRYLDYCSEMLALVAKVGALYVQDFPDQIALQAVDQIEDLASGLSRKIWQKIMILDRIIGEQQALAGMIQSKERGFVS
jgi:hypothetical protein